MLFLRTGLVKKQGQVGGEMGEIKVKTGIGMKQEIRSDGREKGHKRRTGKELKQGQG